MLIIQSGGGSSNNFFILNIALPTWPVSFKYYQMPNAPITIARNVLYHKLQNNSHQIVST